MITWGKQDSPRPFIVRGRMDRKRKILYFLLLLCRHLPVIWHISDCIDTSWLRKKEEKLSYWNKLVFRISVYPGTVRVKVHCRLSESDRPERVCWRCLSIVKTQLPLRRGPFLWDRYLLVLVDLFAIYLCLWLLSFFIFYYWVIWKILFLRCLFPGRKYMLFLLLNKKKTT